LEQTALKGNYSGCLYGLPPPKDDDKEDYLIWTVTGKERESRDQRQGLKERRGKEMRF